MPPEHSDRPKTSKTRDLEPNWFNCTAQEDYERPEGKA